MNVKIIGLETTFRSACW